MINLKNFFNLILAIGTKKSYLFFLVFLMLVSSLADILSLGLIIPYVSQILNLQNTTFDFLPFDLDILKTYSNDNLIFFFTALLIVIFFFKSVISILIRWMITSFSWHQFSILQVKVLSAYQNMKYEDHISRSNSEYIRNIRELCGECLTNIELTLRILSELIILFVIMFFLALINYKILLLFFLTIFPIFLVYEIFLKPINVKLGKINVNATRGMYQNIDVSMKGFKEIRILGKEFFFKKNLEKFANIIYEVQRKSILITDSPRYVFEFFIVFASLVIILIISNKNFELSNYIPVLSMYFIAALRLLPSISLLVSSLSRINSGRYAVTKIVNDLNYLKSTKNNKIDNIEIVTDNFESLKFKNINFSYQNATISVLENVNFELKKNDCIGIMGKSGEGKTTFVDIMLGLLKPQKGEMFINEKLVNEFGSNFVGNIAYLPQEPIILDESIITNVALEIDKKKIDYKKLNFAISQANLDKVIDNLPNKIETKIGDNGIRLSGGQNKRLALSRTFYHGKKIIVIDEATSALDFETESYIAEEIKRIKGKTTIVIISHNKNILKYCDSIYSIQNKTIKLLKENENI
jgi:ATP-binding cassette, subfamily B, bacterial PglK